MPDSNPSEVTVSGSAPPADQVANLHLDEVTGQMVGYSEGWPPIGPIGPIGRIGPSDTDRES